MKKFVRLMNPHTFYYLWQNSNGQKYLTSMINYILKEENKYELLEYFNTDCQNVRSFVLLESDDKIVFIDFNFHKNNMRLNIDYKILNFLQLSTSKKIILIVFNDYIGVNFYKSDIYNIYNNNRNHNIIKFFLAKNYYEQKSYTYNDVLSYLYQYDEKFYDRYVKEAEIQENIYNLINL